MNGVLGDLCARVYRLNCAGEPPEVGKMNEMTLPSRHMIQNSSPDRRRPSTLPLGHGGFQQYGIFMSEWGRSILFL